jgi:hypothetical protein
MDLAQTALAEAGVGLFVAWVAIGDYPELTGRADRHRPRHRTTPRHRRPDPDDSTAPSTDWRTDEHHR